MNGICAGCSSARQLGAEACLLRFQIHHAKRADETRPFLITSHEEDEAKTMRVLSRLSRTSIAVVLISSAIAVQAQSSLTIYADSVGVGWENWSWPTPSVADEFSTSPVQSGTYSLSVTVSAWDALSLHHSELDMSLYGSLSFWIHGGASGGQVLQVVTQYGSNTSPGHVLPALTASQWQFYDIPLTTLGVATVADLHRLTFQLTSGGSAGTFYLDDIQFNPTPIPSLVHIAVDADATLRTADTRWFGANTAIWDNDFGDNASERSTTVDLLNEMGTTTLRFPGGSLSDEYHWATGKSLDNSWAWNTTFAEFLYAATNVGAEVFITVNYGTGTPEEAAGWVRHANVTNNVGIEYWEIGNENYGTWETDSNSLPNHAWTYATRAQQYIAQMKAADPAIKVGVVAAPGENSYDNGYTDHPAYNPRTGTTNYGWTPVLLSTLNSLGVTPDFLVHHHYPQWTDENDPGNSPDNDVTLLQSTAVWANHASELRQHIEDYFGPGGTNIELVVTENNSDAGAQGRQSTSLVNGLYYADSLGELMKTEFNAFVWWDLRNSTDTDGYFGSEIYGWRSYGDLGMINGGSTRHPTFYAAKLIQHLVRGGDAVVQAGTDYSLLASHAVRRTDGTLTLLVLNKSLTTNLNAEISIDGFIPEGTAAVRSYGVPQDEAARTGGSQSAQDIALGNLTGVASTFTHDFPPLSMMVFTFDPTAPGEPVLKVPPQMVADEFVLELEGKAGASYALQKSSDFVSWAAVSTNTLSSSSTLITNSVTPGTAYEFWRAVWVP